MRLNPPTILLFFISLVLAVFALLTKIDLLPIPRVLPHQDFWLAISAYFTLMVGNIYNGL